MASQTASLYYAAPAEKVVCGASQQPVHLSTTVSQLTLQIVPQYATTPGETFAQTGLELECNAPLTRAPRSSRAAPPPVSLRQRLLAAGRESLAASP
jgi:hypothetical protein